MDSVEKIWPNEFNYFFIQSEDENDALDVTLFPNTTDLESGMSGTLVHSRLQSGNFTEDQPVSYLTYIERALENSIQKRH